jgi:hypothetical protein
VSNSEFPHLSAEVTAGRSNAASIEKPKALSLEAKLRFFLFLSSTDPVAKEHLFLE